MGMGLVTMPLLFFGSFGRKPHNSSNSLPKHVCKHPQFKLHVARFVEYCNLFQLPAHQQLGVYKVCMKEAGRYVRDAMQLEAKDENAAMRLLLATISRAIWFNKVSVARKVIQTSPLAAELLDISGATVACKDFVYSNALFDEVHRTYLQKDINAMRIVAGNASTANVRKQLKSRIQAFQRLQAVYFPTN